jgi:hypothetical protein
MLRSLVFLKVVSVLGRLRVFGGAFELFGVLEVFGVFGVNLKVCFRVTLKMLASFEVCFSFL